MEQVIAAARLDKVKYMILTAAFEVDIASAGAHICARCNIPITSEDRMVLESIGDQVHSVSTETKMGLVYIGGYLARRHPALAGRAIDTDACGFIDAMNNGKLTYPCDEMLALLVFLCVQRKLGKSLLSVFAVPNILRYSHLLRLSQDTGACTSALHKHVAKQRNDVEKHAEGKRQTIMTKFSDEI